MSGTSDSGAESTRKQARDPSDVSDHGQVRQLFFDLKWDKHVRAWAKILRLHGVVEPLPMTNSREKLRYAPGPNIHRGTELFGYRDQLVVGRLRAKDFVITDRDGNVGRTDAEVALELSSSMEVQSQIQTPPPKPATQPSKTAAPEPSNKSTPKKPLKEKEKKQFPKEPAVPPLPKALPEVLSASDILGRKTDDPEVHAWHRYLVKVGVLGHRDGVFVRGDRFGHRHRVNLFRDLIQADRLGFSTPAMQMNFRGEKKTPQKVHLTTIHKAFITKRIGTYSEAEQLMRLDGLNLIPAAFRTTEETVEINFLLDFIN